MTPDPHSLTTGQKKKTQKTLNRWQPTEHEWERVYMQTNIFIAVNQSRGFFGLAVLFILEETMWAQDYCWADCTVAGGEIQNMEPHASEPGLRGSATPSSPSAGLLPSCSLFAISVIFLYFLQKYLLNNWTFAVYFILGFNKFH